MDHLTDNFEHAGSHPIRLERILKEQELDVGAEYRNGPRFWVGEVRREDTPYLLKAVINDMPMKAGDEIFTPSDQVETEIRTITTLTAHEDAIAGGLDHIVASSIESPAWFMRELNVGHDLAKADSPFFFEEGEPSTETTTKLIDYIESYQRLTPQLIQELGLTAPAKATLQLRVESLGLNYLAGYHPPLAAYADKVKGYVEERRELHDSSLNTFSHTQVYPPHIYEHDGEISLIDWESSRVHNKFRDFVGVWIRGFDRPEWQENIKTTLEAKGYFATPEDEELWGMEVLLQSVGNISYLSTTESEQGAETEAAIASMQRHMDRILGAA